MRLERIERLALALERLLVSRLRWPDAPPGRYLANVLITAVVWIFTALFDAALIFGEIRSVAENWPRLDDPWSAPSPSIADHWALWVGALLFNWIALAFLIGWIRWIRSVKSVPPA